MKKTDTERFKTIKWFFDLIAVDIDEMSELDFSKLVLEAQYYLSTEAALIPSFYGSVASFGYRRTQALQQDGIQWNKSLKLVQREIRALLRVAFHPGIPPSWPLEFYLIGECSLQFGPFVDRNVYVSFLFHELHEKTPENMAKLAKIKFCCLLDGLPHNSIRRCDECGKYFIHLSRKPKYYCNPKCTSKAMSRKRREADPDGYRKKQREIMRKKYREKKAQELGVSPDKIKIQKRVKD